MDFYSLVLVAAMVCVVKLGTVLCVDTLAPHASRFLKLVTHIALFAFFIGVAISFLPPSVVESGGVSIFFAAALGAFLGHQFSRMLKKNVFK